MTSLNNSPNTAPPTSSPPLLSSPMVSAKKRVARTYGSKRVEAPPSDESPDADTSFGTLVDGDISTLLSPAARSNGIGDNVASSQDTKVDDDDDGDDSPKQQKYQWSWVAALKELTDSDEAELTPAYPIPRRSADVDAAPSPPASRGRGAKSKGKYLSTSPKKFQRLPLKTIRSDSRASARVSAEPEASGSDGDRSPSPSPPKQKRHTSGRTGGAITVDGSDSEAPRASSSKSRGSRLNSVDMDANDRTSPDPPKRKRKTTTSIKPTAKVNPHYMHSIGSY